MLPDADFDEAAGAALAADFADVFLFELVDAALVDAALFRAVESEAFRF